MSCVGYKLCRCRHYTPHLRGMVASCRHSGATVYRIRVWFGGLTPTTEKRATKWSASRLLSDVMRRYPQAVRIDIDCDTSRPCTEDSPKGVMWVAAKPQTVEWERDRDCYEINDEYRS
jgi:hypothetical protein